MSCVFDPTGSVVITGISISSDDTASFTIRGMSSRTCRPGLKKYGWQIISSFFNLKETGENDGLERR